MSDILHGKPASADEIVEGLMAPKDLSAPAPVGPFSSEEARFDRIVRVFHEAGDAVSQAARPLNIHRRTLQCILKRYGVSTDATQ